MEGRRGYKASLTPDALTKSSGSTAISNIQQYYHCK
jgi:hypothetical protein